MAKVYGPLGGTMASGKLGKAYVYGNWRGIAWVRAYRVPQNPQSPAQQAVRAAQRAAVQAWKILSRFVKGAYNVFAEVGRSSSGPGGKRATKMSGYNLFVGLVRRLDRFPFEGPICGLTVNPDFTLDFGLLVPPPVLPVNAQCYYAARPWAKWQRATAIWDSGTSRYHVPAPFVDLPVTATADVVAVVVVGNDNTTGAKVFIASNWTDAKVVENVACP
jgi:hypothetical protein